MNQLKSTLYIIRFELQQRLRLATIWSFFWSLYVIMMFSFFNKFAETAKDLEQFYASFPKEFLEAFQFDATTMSTIEGYFNTEVLTFYLLLASILGAYWGISAIGREISNRSILFLLSKPVSRLNIFFSKATALVLLSIITNGIFFAMAVLSVDIFVSKDWPATYFALTYLGAVFIQVTFSLLGLLLGIIVKESASMGVTIMITIVTFMADIMGKLQEIPDEFGYISPFYYFNLRYVADNDTFKTPEIYVLILIPLILLIIGALAFRKRDIDV